MHGDPAGTAVAARLLGGIRERDFAEIRACFAPDAKLRVLTPHRVREDDGQDAIAERYAFWLDALDGYRLLSADAEWIADRIRIRYRFLGRDARRGWQENEHTAYATLENGAIVALNISCAGFRPAEDR